MYDVTWCPLAHSEELVSGAVLYVSAAEAEGPEWARVGLTANWKIRWSNYYTGAPLSFKPTMYAVLSPPLHA